MSDDTTNTFDFEALIEGVKCKHKVRVVTREGNPWFLGSDVLKVLYGKPSNHSHSYDKLAADETGYLQRKQLGASGGRDYRLVSEGGLYKLIMRSDKPAAKPFQDWVTRAVLPSIRKTGGYQLGAGETMPLPTDFAHALELHAQTLILLAQKTREEARTAASSNQAQLRWPYRVLGRFWSHDWRKLLDTVKALPSGLAHAFERQPQRPVCTGL